MKILLTGATGYIGRRLLPILLEQGHHVVCFTRSPERLRYPENRKEQITSFQGDLLSAGSLQALPKDIEVAYYLVHSMSATHKNFAELEKKSADNFIQALEKSACRQIIYLSGIANSPSLSPHLRSRLNVEKSLQASRIPVTTLRAAIVIGSGSASFEIIRDLVEKLPVMVAPKWVDRLCQPIALFDVLDYLIKVIDHQGCLGKSFDIGGPNVLTYKNMLLTLAKLRGLKRFIFTIPVLTPRLSSLWLALITSTNFELARSLVDSLKNDAVCAPERSLDALIPKTCLSYDEALRRAFSQIEENSVISSWKDAWNSSKLTSELSAYIQIPKEGCFVDTQIMPIHGGAEKAIQRLFSIGGNRGWYYMDWAWSLRGLIDKVCGGVGLQRGRTNLESISPGDALDFWRVIFADQKKGRLLLYAEMKLPGEAWLEFSLVDRSGVPCLKQEATFRPKGLGGRLYWYALYPFHLFIFRGMCRKLSRG